MLGKTVSTAFARPAFRDARRGSARRRAQQVHYCGWTGLVKLADSTYIGSTIVRQRRYPDFVR